MSASVFSPNPEQLAALAHGRSLCLTAGAGSGKTATLVQKYMQLLIDQNFRPDAILAITFTEKAAAEMQVRIRGELDRRVAEERDFERAAALEEKRVELSGAWISTIHAFGARVLREHAAEAGLDPGFDLLNESDSAELWEQAAVATVMEHAAQPAVASFAVRLGLGAGAISGRAAGLPALILNVRETMDAEAASPQDIHVQPPPDPFDPSPLHDLLDRALASPDVPESFAPRLPALRALRDCARAGTPPDVFLQTLDRAGWDFKEERIKPGRAAKSFKPLLLTASLEAGKLARGATDQIEWECVGSMRMLIERMTARAEEEKRKRRALDFSDLEFLTCSLLRDQSAVLEHYRARFAAVLIDEFQDVNPIQARIVELLTEGRPRSLFAVGDPKQSIYRFRGADVRQFRALWDRMQADGSALGLQNNYRSHPKIVETVNRFFNGQVWRERGEAEMVSARPEPDGSSDEAAADSAPHTLWIESPARISASARREYEAGMVAEWIKRDAAANGRPWASYAVLFRTISKVSFFEETFKRLEIPYELVKAGGAYQSQELFDLLNVLTAAFDSSDPIAMLGALRSPFGGVSDDALALLLPPPASGALPDGLSEQNARAAAEFFDLLRRLREERSARAPSRLIEWLIDETGYFALLEGLDQPDARRRNAGALIALARQYDSALPDPMHAFLQAAWRMVRAREKESGAGAPGDTDSVKLMTIHQSKGLEFDVVIIPELMWKKNYRPPNILFTPPRSLTLRVPLAGSSGLWPSTRWSAEGEREKRELDEEYLRLLYVAMTRAREQLVLPGPDEPGKAGSFWEHLHPFVDRERDLVERLTPDAPRPAAVTPLAEPDWTRLPPAVEPARYDSAPWPKLISVTQIGRVSATGAPSAAASGRGRVSATGASSAGVSDDGRAGATVSRRGGPACPPLPDHPNASCGGRAYMFYPSPLPIGGEGRGEGARRSGRSRRLATVLGTIAHAVLARVPLHAPADKQAAWSKAYLEIESDWTPLPRRERAGLQASLSQFFRGELAARLRDKSARAEREHPFTLHLGETRYVRGVIDLFIEGDSIEVYDYKYEKPKRDFAAYRTQLYIYGLAAAQARGLDRITVGLQFLLGDQPNLTESITVAQARAHINAVWPSDGS